MLNANANRTLKRVERGEERDADHAQRHRKTIEQTQREERVQAGET
jgi:hypothetical protein